RCGACTSSWGCRARPPRRMRRSTGRSSCWRPRTSPASTSRSCTRAGPRRGERALLLPRPQTVTLMALHLRGDARCSLGDLDGLEDLREALKVAQGSDVPVDVIPSSAYL